jgi:hypothetical protein
MIFTLNIIIDLCLIFAVWRVSKKKQNLEVRFPVIQNNQKLKGRIDKIHITAKVAEKFAERAFNMASASNLAVVALQRTLATPRILTKEQGVKNLLAKKEVDELFTNKGMMDWLKPTMSDEELDLLEKAEEHHAKFNGKGV